MWHTGMLRGIDERDMVATLEYQGKGTIQVDGQPCTLTKYRASTNYQTLGSGFSTPARAPNGQTYSNDRGRQRAVRLERRHARRGDRSGEGKATPMPAAVQERLIRLWASPQGAPKAALADHGHSERAPTRARCCDGGATDVAQTSVSWEAGKPVVTFPIPGVPGATATATLDAKYMAERVVVKQGSTTTEFTYSDYQDWNNPLNKIEVLYAGKMTERRNGAVVRDLTTTETETGNVYVVAPVPASVKKAIKVTVPAPPARPMPEPRPGRSAPALAQDQPTPRRPTGIPDLTGNWQRRRDCNWRYGTAAAVRRRAPTARRTVNQTMRLRVLLAVAVRPNRPVYKPEHWDKVQQLDMWTNK